MADAHGQDVHEEDPFGQFLSQDQAAVAEPQMPAYHDHVPAAPMQPQVDANDHLRMLVETSQRQEQLLGKVCSLLLGLDEKMGRLAAAQEHLEQRLEQLAASGPAPAAAGGYPLPHAPPQPTRGSMLTPPGKDGAVPRPGGAAAPGAPAPRAPYAEDPAVAAERMAAERARIEEEGRKRAEELARKREDDERRKREEAEARRIEEERRREEERKRKEALHNKTTGLMTGLLNNDTGGGGLFDDEPKRKNRGGLFDD